MRRTTPWWRAATLCGLLALSGCGSGATTSSAPGSLSPTPETHPLSFAVSITLSGAVNLSGAVTDTQTVAIPSTCSGWASTGLAGILAVPGGGIGVSAAGQSLTYTALVANYHGPNDYHDTRDLPAITVGGDLYGPGGQASRLTIHVAADGSGSASFQGFPSVADSSRTLDGTITWTCAPLATTPETPAGTPTSG